MRCAHPSLAELSTAWAERRALCGFGGARGGRVGTVAPCVASALGPPPTGPQLGPVTVIRGRGEDVPSCGHGRPGAYVHAPETCSPAFPTAIPESVSDGRGVPSGRHGPGNGCGALGRAAHVTPLTRPDACRGSPSERLAFATHCRSGRLRPGGVCVQWLDRDSRMPLNGRGGLSRFWPRILFKKVLEGP